MRLIGMRRGGRSEAQRDSEPAMIGGNVMRFGVGSVGEEARAFGCLRALQVGTVDGEGALTRAPGASEFEAAWHWHYGTSTRACF